MARNREFLLNASAGLLAGFIYLSYVLSFAFLVPVQHAFAARGNRSGLIAASFAFLVIAAGQIFRMLEMKVVDPLVLASGLLPPLLLLAALGFINVKPGRLGRGASIVLATALLSALAAPFVLKATSDKNFSAWLVEYVAVTMNSTGASGDAVFNARTAVDSAMGMIRSAFSALILWMLAGSWWIGSVIVARRRKVADEGAKTFLSMADIRVPSIALWPTLLAWTLLLVVLMTGQSGYLAAAAWNIALCSASVYAIQGMGILSHLSRQFNATRFLRLLAPIAVLAVALSSAVGAIIMIALPVLGITEVWLPYRTIKGALK
ncbi:MAG: hypothetical protein CVV53_05105 [Spirochaetae bacterium HGW-Spirochaetae-9]|nr:MAG: hypothetical protein CVV53_05105 [Spirochaetae bacterium HGW-Spirochaetae-9]